MSLVRVQLWEPERADDESRLLFVALKIIYTAWLLIKMELVNGAKAEWKPEKENCTVYSFPGVAACGESNCGSQREQVMKVICFFVYFRGYIYSLTVNQDGVGEQSEIYSISQSATLTALFTKESLAIPFGLKCWFTAKQFYQREPCCSFGLKCWFAIKQVYQRDPILWFI